MLSVVKLHDVTHLNYHLISNIYHFQSVHHIYTVFTTMIEAQKLLIKKQTFTMFICFVAKSTA